MYSWLENPLQKYLQMRASNRLSHAILLCAPEGIGSGVLAMEFARRFLCLRDQGEECSCHSCMMLKGAKHPDLTVIERTGQSIGVDALRKGINSLVSTPVNAHGKVLLIKQADFMTVQASNALLKTLEEPAPNILIILTTSNIMSILPTILSRTMRIQVNVPSVAELNTFLQRETSSSRDFSMELAVSGMSPLKVLEWIENGSDTKLHKCLELFVNMMLGNGDIRKLAADMEALFKEDSILLHGFMYALIKDVMYYQNGVLPENLRILKNEQVLEHLAGIDPESLGQAAKKVVMLRGAGVGPSGIKNSFINSMQLLCWLERLKGY